MTPGPQVPKASQLAARSLARSPPSHLRSQGLTWRCPSPARRLLRFATASPCLGHLPLVSLPSPPRKEEEEDKGESAATTKGKFHSLSAEASEAKGQAAARLAPPLSREAPPQPTAHLRRAAHGEPRGGGWHPPALAMREEVRSLVTQLPGGGGEAAASRTSSWIRG